MDFTDGVFQCEVPGVSIPWNADTPGLLTHQAEAHACEVGYGDDSAGVEGPSPVKHFFQCQMFTAMTGFVANRRSFNYAEFALI
jgi:hypothetical protein